MDKWFMLQSQSQLPDSLAQVKSLTVHPQFDANNPNKLYALVRAFSANNLLFNTAEGYRFIADEVLRIDKFNSGVASRVAQGFSIVNSLNSIYQKLAQPELQRILADANLSKDVYEIISKTINQLN
jgi:aminopeptidase N